MYEIPHLPLLKAFIILGLCDVASKLIFGFVIFSGFMTMFLIFLPLMVVISYIIFFMTLECERVKEIYDEVKEDITNK